MGLFDAFGYQGKRALVVGGASGMGAATVDVLRDAGAEITMMDRAEVSTPGVTFHPLDLSDRAGFAESMIPGPPFLVQSYAGTAHHRRLVSLRLYQRLICALTEAVLEGAGQIAKAPFRCVRLSGP